MKKLALVVPFVAAFSASTAFAGPSAKDASNAIFEAVKMNSVAAKAGFEWRDTYKKLIGPAKKAYKKGNYAKAVKLANTAKAHAELGLQQARVGKNADLRSN